MLTTLVEEIAPGAVMETTLVQTEVQAPGSDAGSHLGGNGLEFNFSPAAATPLNVINGFSFEVLINGTADNPNGALSLTAYLGADGGANNTSVVILHNHSFFYPALPQKIQTLHRQLGDTSDRAGRRSFSTRGGRTPYVGRRMMPSKIEHLKKAALPDRLLDSPVRPREGNWGHVLTCNFRLPSQAPGLANFGSKFQRGCVCGEGGVDSRLLV